MKYLFFTTALLLAFAPFSYVDAATLLSNITEANNKGDFVVRSNIWYAFKFTAGSGGTISGITVNLDETESNYTNFSTHTGLVVKFYSDNSGAMGSQIGGQLNYTSTNTGNGHTVYDTLVGDEITLPSAGNYWIGFAPPSAANIYIQMTGSSGYTGATDWATFLGTNGIADYYSGTSYFSSATYGVPMMTIAGTSNADSVAPIVSVSAPSADATVSGASVTLSASASDDTAVAGVKFYVDGVLQGSEDTGAPYSITWDSTAITSGVKTVTAVARDSAGNVATSSGISITVDNTPTPSGVSVSTTDSTASITWTTGKTGTSRVFFGVINDTASSTSEVNTGGSATTSHSVSLSGLSSCTVYSYRAVSRTSGGLDTATTSSGTFKTTGCTGSATITDNSQSSVEVASGGTVTHDQLTLSVPASFTSTSSSVMFQASTIDTTSFINSAGTPSGKTRAGSVYHLKALTDATTTITTFDESLTVTLSYSDSDVSGLDESTLVIYRYDGSSWSALSNCSVDTGANTVSCTTTAFSEFGIFGDEATSASSGSGARTTTVADQLNNLLAIGNVDYAVEIINERPAVASEQTDLVLEVLQTKLDLLFAQLQELQGTNTPVVDQTTEFAAKDIPKSDLSFGMEGDDVRQLQELLISFASGPATNELARVGATGYFGRYTQNALGEFQKTHGIQPYAGYFGPITRMYLHNL